MTLQEAWGLTYNTVITLTSVTIYTLIICNVTIYSTSYYYHIG